MYINISGDDEWHEENRNRLRARDCVAILDIAVRACWRRWNELRKQAVWRAVGRGFQALGTAWIKAPSEEGIWYRKGTVESHGYPKSRVWRREKWKIMSESWAEVIMWIIWPMRRNSFILSVTRGPWSQRVTLSYFPFKNVSLASVWSIGSRRAIQEAGRPVRRILESFRQKYWRL